VWGGNGKPVWTFQMEVPANMWSRPEVLPHYQVDALGYNFDNVEEALAILRDPRLEHVEELHKFSKDCHAVKQETHLLHLSDTCRFSAMVFRQEAWCITWLDTHELAGWLEEYDSRKKSV
jgi:hypothetical protein